MSWSLRRYCSSRPYFIFVANIYYYRESSDENSHSDSDDSLCEQTLSENSEEASDVDTVSFMTTNSFLPEKKTVFISKRSKKWSAHLFRRFTSLIENKNSRSRIRKIQNLINSPRWRCVWLLSTWIFFWLRTLIFFYASSNLCNN